MAARFLTQWKSRDTGHRVWPVPFLGALALGLAAGVLSITPYGQRLEHQVGLWLLFNLRGPVAPPPEVVIIAMRGDTGVRVSLPAQRSRTDPCADVQIDAKPRARQPLGDVPQRWGRCHHVELLRRLAFAQPSAVAMDITFRPRTDIDSAEDRALGRAMRALGNVVVAEILKRSEGLDGNPVVGEVVEISPEIAAAAVGRCVMPLPIPLDQRYDKFWTFMPGGFAAPTLPALTLQAHSLDVTPQFLDLVRRTFPEAAQDLPASAAELTRDGALHLHALRLRAIFREAPERAARLAGEPGARKLQALVSLYAGENERFLNLYGRGAIRTLSITDVLSTPHTAHSPDPLGLKGKVVFVGFADDVKWEGLDKYYTVYSAGGRQWSGVQIAASAFANLLDGSSLRPTPRWTRALIAFLAGTGTALLCYAATTAVGTLAAGAALFAYMGVALLLFKHAHVWAPTFLPVALAAPAGFAIGFVRKFADVRGDSAALGEILGKFVPRSMVSKLMENRGRLGETKETTQAACVMTDVEGYTALSTRFSSAQIDALLSAYFAVLFEPVARLGGFISDLKGDSILAIWADRSSETAVRERVCDACLELMHAVDRFNAEHPDTPMPTRIGVNYGEVTLGAVGALFHFEYRAVGDTVNTASRVEQLSKALGTHLLVTAALVDGLQPFLVRDLGEFQLRGRRTPTRIFELIARLEQAQPEQLDLCADFASALEAYEHGQIEQARAGFDTLIERHADGPSGYYRRLIDRT